MTPGPTIMGIPPPAFDLQWWQAALAGVAAVASLIAAGAALWALSYFRRQTTAASIAVGMESLWKLIEQWDSDSMRRRRVRAASALMQKPKTSFTQDVVDIANHFEHLGYLVFVAKAVGPQDAWGLFSTWAGPYWYAMHVDLEEQQSEDPTLWEHYKELVDEFDRIERKKRALSKDADLPYRGELELLLGDEQDLLKEEDEAAAERTVACHPTPRGASPTSAGASLRASWYRLRCVFSRRRS